VLADVVAELTLAVGGFVAGSFVMLIVSLSILGLAVWIPVRYMGLLSLIPITLGLRALLRPTNHNDSTGSGIDGTSWKHFKVTLSAAALMVANGGDTIVVFAPLFAETEPSGVGVIVIGFVLSSIALAFFSSRVCIHPRLSEPLRRYGPKVAPFVMIGIGIYIMLNTGTDTLLDG